MSLVKVSFDDQIFGVGMNLHHLMVPVQADMDFVYKVGMVVEALPCYCRANRSAC